MDIPSATANSKLITITNITQLPICFVSTSITEKDKKKPPSETQQPRLTTGFNCSVYRSKERNESTEQSRAEQINCNVNANLLGCSNRMAKWRKECGIRAKREGVQVGFWWKYKSD